MKIESVCRGDLESIGCKVAISLYIAKKARLATKINMREKSVEHFRFGCVNVEDVAVGS